MTTPNKPIDPAEMVIDHYEHLEKFAAAFIKETGLLNIKDYVLVQKHTTLYDREYSFRLKNSDEYSNIRKGEVYAEGFSAAIEQCIELLESCVETTEHQYGIETKSIKFDVIRKIKALKQ